MISSARTLGSGEIVEFFRAFVSEAKDVEAGFVAVDEFLAVWKKRFAFLFPTEVGQCHVSLVV